MRSVAQAQVNGIENRSSVNIFVYTIARTQQVPLCSPGNNFALRVLAVTFHQESLGLNLES